MLFKRSFGLTRGLFILYVHEHRLGFGMLTVETAVTTVADFSSSNCDRKGQSYPVENSLESVEENSEGKIHMSEPESGNGNVNTVYFVNQTRGNTRISRTEFVHRMNEHAIVNVYLDLIFPLRIMLVKNLLLQISICA